MSNYVTFGINSMWWLIQGYNTYATCKKTYEQYQTLKNQNSLSNKQIAVFAITAGVALVNVVVLVKMTEVNYKCFKWCSSARNVNLEEDKFLPLFEEENPRESWVEFEIDDNERSLLNLAPGEKVFQPKAPLNTYATPAYRQARTAVFENAINFIQSELEDKKSNARLLSKMFNIAQTTMKFW